MYNATMDYERKYNRASNIIDRFQPLISIYKEDHIIRLAKRLTDSSFLFLMKLQEVAEDVFGENFEFKLQLAPKAENYLNEYGLNTQLSGRHITGIDIQKANLIVRFPEIQISNSKKKSHTIKDLFIRLVINFPRQGVSASLSSLYGMRMIVSIEEFLNGYKHSHLQGVGANLSKYPEFSKYCVGTADFVSALSLADDDEDQIRLAFMELNDLVRWESLEGGPHKHFSEITNKTVSTLTSTENVRLEVLKACKQRILAYSCDLTWAYVNNKYVIINDEKFDNFCQAILYDHITDPIIVSAFLYRDNANNYYLRNNNRPAVQEGIIRMHEDYWYKFRNEYVFLTVEDFKEENTKLQDKLHMNPKIKDYVIARLSEQFNQGRIKTTAVRRLNSSDYSRECSYEDQVSLF